MNVLWHNSFKKIFIIFLCLGLISGIVLYWASPNTLNTTNSRLITTNLIFGGKEVRAETMTTSVTITVCGNGILETGEECDDGNSDNTDSCLNTCVDASCGDGYVWSGQEECDDGNTNSGDGCSSTCQTEEEEEAPAPGGGGGPALPPKGVTKVILQGKSSPLAYLTILQDGQVLTTIRANSQADFKVEISNITAGTYTFGIWAVDKNGIKSLTFSFTVNVVSGVTTTVSGIFIPPTISLSKDVLQRGEILNVAGQTAPQSDVEVHVNSEEIIENIIADSGGTWLYNLDTGRLEEGVHSVRAKASTEEGLLSTFSQTLLFGVGVGLPPAEGLCPHADLNKDGRVDLIDFSILLYWWGRSNDCADQNGDGIVDLIDFSIMMYYWTG